MKKNFIILIAFVALITSCKKNYLNVNDVNAFVTPDQLYSNYNYAQQAVWNIYSYLPDGFAHLDYEAITDNASATNVTDVSKVFNNGTWNQYNNPDDSWTRDFEGIRQANLYLKNKDSVNITYIRDKIVTSDSSTWYNAQNNVKFMQGEALFLKAFFYFDLVKRYGGVPVMNQPLDYNSPASWKNIPRNSVDECIHYITLLCDSAAGIIPANLAPYSWYALGRVTYGAIKALKARTLLYAASPLFKSAGTTATWADAASALHDVIALNAYSLDSKYSNLFGSGNSSSKELIFYRRYGNINTIEKDNFPIVFQNSDGNSTTPSQNFVDGFEVLMKDGSGNVTGSRPFDWTELERSRQRIHELGFSEDSNADEVALRSPISGVVIDIGSAAGEMQRSLDNATPIATIANIDSVWIIGDIFERDLSSIKPGREVQVLVPAYPNLSLTGKIANIGDALDPNTHTLKLRVVLPNPQHTLKTDMFATIRIPGAARSAAIVPETAVLHEGDKTSVFIQNASGKFDQRAVTIGRTFVSGSMKTVEVLSGINDGEKVVTVGGALLRPTNGD